ncbi:MAG: dehydrogenase [Desulfobacterales bacterium]|jgi:2-oxoisovalerate dehydrogenase E1 component|nr:dehydrogenase [Desulfobacteraceae bacterium]MBT4365117.1 dehydrogenase [Desulfobacteraceae bacterium]MBT7085570.1 dehydrogenase [Desulfobacterales bacterium]
MKPVKESDQDYNLNVIPEFPIKIQDIKIDGEAGTKTGTTSKPGNADLLKTMHIIRFFELHLSEAILTGVLPTFAIHLSIGQEAVATGVCMNLRNTDYLNTTHRGHGHIIAKGADLNRMMAEIYGRKDGQCMGRGGSMHVTDGNRGILGANGIVGAGYLLAMGAGYTIKNKGRDDVSVVIAGDGSVNQGMFHESMNMISLFDLPVLIVVENNLYGEFTPIDKHSAVTEMYKRAQAYGIESCRLNGNDVKEVFTETGKIIEKIRTDSKPRLVELMTYRWHGHMEGDGELYRTEEEKERYKKEDPILRIENQMLQDKELNQEEIQKIKSDAEKQVKDAIAFAEQSEEPKPSELLSNSYSPEQEFIFQGEISIPDKQTKEITTSEAIREAILEEMERDENVFLWGEDVTLGGYFNVTDGLVDQFGKNRIIDTPISENAIIGGAVGAAMTGMRPVAEILFSDFLTCCMDPIMNQAAKLRYMTGGQVSIPLTIRTPAGSAFGMAAQHSQSIERMFAGIPGLIVAAPSDAATAKGLLKTAIRSNNPVLFFEHKLLYLETAMVPVEEYTLPLGKARVLKTGKDVTIVTHLFGVGVAREVANILEASGISAEVIDLITLYPMDTETILKSVAKTGRLVTIEEGHATLGIGSEVITRIVTAGFNLLKSAPLRIAAQECPIPYAKDLENSMMPGPEEIAEKIKKLT